MTASVFDVIAQGGNAGALLNEQRAIRLACICEVYSKYYHQGLEPEILINAAWLLERWVTTGVAPALTARPFPNSPFHPPPAAPTP